MNVVMAFQVGSLTIALSSNPIIQPPSSPLLPLPVVRSDAQVLQPRWAHSAYRDCHWLQEPSSAKKGVREKKVLGVLRAYGGVAKKFPLPRVFW
jgi:hypothetical protein